MHSLILSSKLSRNIHQDSSKYSKLKHIQFLSFSSHIKEGHRIELTLFDATNLLMAHQTVDGTVNICFY